MMLIVTVEQGSMASPQLYSRIEGAQYLGISPRTIDTLIALNLIPYRRRPSGGPKGVILFTEDDLLAIIDSWRVGPTTSRRTASARNARR